MRHAHSTAERTGRQTRPRRLLLIAVALLALIAAIATLPVVIIIVAMNLDSPGVSWNLLHISMLGLPAALIACAGAAAWGAAMARLRPLRIATTLLVVDAMVLIIMWNTASA